MTTPGEATAASGAQAPLSVVVGHHPGGVTIHVQAPEACQGGIDTGSVVAFLSSIDPEQLERDVLDGLGMLEDEGETSVTAATLKRLIAYADGSW